MQLEAKGELQKSLLTLKLRWREDKPAPRRMYKVCNAVANNGMVYFNAGDETLIYCYDTNSDLWTRLLNIAYGFVAHLLLSTLC